MTMTTPTPIRDRMRIARALRATIEEYAELAGTHGVEYALMAAEDTWDVRTRHTALEHDDDAHAALRRGIVARSTRPAQRRAA